MELLKKMEAFEVLSSWLNFYNAIIVSNSSIGCEDDIIYGKILKKRHCATCLRLAKQQKGLCSDFHSNATQVSLYSYCSPNDTDNVIPGKYLVGIWMYPSIHIKKSTKKFCSENSRKYYTYLFVNIYL